MTRNEKLRKESQALRNEIDELKALVTFLKCSFIRLYLSINLCFFFFSNKLLVLLLLLFTGLLGLYGVIGQRSLT